MPKRGTKNVTMLVTVNVPHDHPALLVRRSVLSLINGAGSPELNATPELRAIKATAVKKEPK